MKLLRNTSLLAVVLLLFSSCFEITEEVSMNEDGSGTFRLTVNLSESRQSLVNYMKMEEVEGIKVPSQAEIEANLDLVSQTLREMKGLSKVVVKRDFERFVFVFSGAFAEVATLNAAINEVVNTLNRTASPILEEQNFAHSAQQFTRQFKYPIPEDVYENASLTMRYLLDTARLVSVFRFSKPIQKSTNQHTLVSPSRKSVMLQATIAELVKGEIQLDNQIHF